MLISKWITNFIRDIVGGKNVPLRLKFKTVPIQIKIVLVRNSSKASNNVEPVITTYKELLLCTGKLTKSVVLNRYKNRKLYMGFT